MGRNLADEEGEAMAALLGPLAAGRRDGKGGTAVRPKAVPATATVAPSVGGAPAWLPWLVLGLGAAIGVGCILGGVALAGALAQAIWPDGTERAWLIDLLFNVLVFVPMLALALLAAWRTRVRALAAGAAPGAMLALGAGVGVAGVAVATGYAALSGVAQGGGGAAAGPLLLAGTLSMLLQSGSEEVLLRGWMQPAIATRWPIWTAILLTAMVFAGLHVLGGARSPIELINLALGGILFGLLRWKSGGLVAPLAAHFAWNWSEGLLLGLDPNPGIGSFGALFDLDFVGPAIWGGSEQGLNGSLAMLLVLLAMIVPLALWRGKVAG